jgi:hypothetical protein
MRISATSSSEIASMRIPLVFLMFIIASTLRGALVGSALLAALIAGVALLAASIAARSKRATRSKCVASSAYRQSRPCKPSLYARDMPMSEFRIPCAGEDHDNDYREALRGYARAPPLIPGCWSAGLARPAMSSSVCEGSSMASSPIELMLFDVCAELRELAIAAKEDGGGR